MVSVNKGSSHFWAWCQSSWKFIRSLWWWKVNLCLFYLTIPNRSTLATNIIVNCYEVINIRAGNNGPAVRSCSAAWKVSARDAHDWSASRCIGRKWGIKPSFPIRWHQRRCPDPCSHRGGTSGLLWRLISGLLSVTLEFKPKPARRSWDLSEQSQTLTNIPTECEVGILRIAMRMDSRFGIEQLFENSFPIVLGFGLHPNRKKHSSCSSRTFFFNLILPQRRLAPLAFF